MEKKGANTDGPGGGVPSVAPSPTVTTFVELPVEILANILGKLDLTTQIRCTGVCSVLKDVVETLPRKVLVLDSAGFRKYARTLVWDSENRDLYRNIQAMVKDVEVLIYCGSDCRLLFTGEDPLYAVRKACQYGGSLASRFFPKLRRFTMEKVLISATARLVEEVLTKLPPRVQWEMRKVELGFHLGSALNFGGVGDYLAPVKVPYLAGNGGPGVVWKIRVAFDALFPAITEGEERLVMRMYPLMNPGGTQFLFSSLENELDSLKSKLTFRFTPERFHIMRTSTKRQMFHWASVAYWRQNGK